MNELSIFDYDGMYIVGEEKVESGSTKIAEDLGFIHVKLRAVLLLSSLLNITEYLF